MGTKAAGQCPEAPGNPLVSVPQKKAISSLTPDSSFMFLLMQGYEKRAPSYMLHHSDLLNTYCLYFPGGCHIILGRSFWYHKILCVHPVPGTLMGFV